MSYTWKYTKAAHTNVARTIREAKKRVKQTQIRPANATCPTGFDDYRASDRLDAEG